MFYSDGRANGDKVMHLMSNCGDYRNILMVNRREARPCKKRFGPDLLSMISIILKSSGASERSAIGAAAFCPYAPMVPYSLQMSPVGAIGDPQPEDGYYSGTRFAAR